MDRLNRMLASAGGMGGLGGAAPGSVSCDCSPKPGKRYGREEIEMIELTYTQGQYQSDR